MLDVPCAPAVPQAAPGHTHRTAARQAPAGSSSSSALLSVTQVCTWHTWVAGSGCIRPPSCHSRSRCAVWGPSCGAYLLDTLWYGGWVVAVLLLRLLLLLATLGVVIAFGRGRVSSCCHCICLACAGWSCLVLAWLLQRHQQVQLGVILCENSILADSQQLHEHELQTDPCKTLVQRTLFWFASRALDTSCLSTSKAGRLCALLLMNFSQSCTARSRPGAAGALSCSLDTTAAFSCLACACTSATIVARGTR